MGLVFIKVPAFKEVRVAEELKDYFYLVDENVEVKTFSKYPGIILVKTNLYSSIDLAREILSKVFFRQWINFLSPIEIELITPSLNDIVNTTIRYVRSKIDKVQEITCKIFCRSGVSVLN